MKRVLPHGTWTTWLHENFEGSARTAQVYMQLSRYPQHAADLPSVREALCDLRSPASDATDDMTQFREWERERDQVRDEMEELKIGLDGVKNAPPSDAAVRVCRDIAERASALEERTLSLTLHAQRRIEKLLKELAAVFNIPPEAMHGEQLDIILRVCDEYEMESTSVT